MQDLLYNIALCGDINFGNCTLDKESMAGAYLGLGFGVARANAVNIIRQTQLDNSYYDASNKTIQDLNSYRVSGLSFGPIFHGGVKFGDTRPFGVNLAYQPAINKSALDYYTIAIQIPFGNQMIY
jgi:hypothetical protein